MSFDDPATAGDRRPRRPPRLRRFARRHGWRASAIPALTVLAVVALVVALAAPPEPGSSAAAEPSDLAGGTAVPSMAAPTAEGEQAAPYAGDPAAPTSAYAQAGDGVLNVVPGQSPVLGTGGPVTTFDVEVEGGLGLDGVHFAQYVEQVLGDPRSWGAGGRLSFQRVSGGQADLHVALVSPDHVEGLCPGYGTDGYTSCRYQDRAVINLARWSVGVQFYAGRLDEYREYVINHEVGHYLGHGHADCPAPAQKAPVMMQQTLDIAECTTNSWPYPNGPADDPDAPA